MSQWEANDGKTRENKPVTNQAEFEQKKSAIGCMEVIWNHIPSHKEIRRNKIATQLAHDEIGETTSLNEGDAQENDEFQDLREIIVDASSLLQGSETSSDSNEEIIILKVLHVVEQILRRKKVLIMGLRRHGHYIRIR